MNPYDLSSPITRQPLEEVNIVIKKTIEKVIFETPSKYHARFARELAYNGFSVKTAFDKTYHTINKIRASYLLNEPKVWMLYFEELSGKMDPEPIEREHLELFNTFKETFNFCPFSAYTWYTQATNEQGQSINELISTDLFKDLQVLIYLYNFFTILNREQFREVTRTKMMQVYDNIMVHEKLLDSPNKARFSLIVKQALKDNIDVKEILEIEE